MRRVIRWAIQGGAVLATIVGVVAVIARFSDGPIFVFPGGPLMAGLPTEYKSVDWAKLAQIREIEFQLENPPRSRTTRIIIYNDAPYVPCAFCTNRILKRWPRELEQDDRVVLRIDGMLIQGVARRVPNGSEEYLAARRAHTEKYLDRSRLQNSVESRTADVVVGAARLAPGARDSEEPGSWLYRIDAR